MRQEIAHQLKQFVLAIGPVAAPPIAQRPARNQGNGAAQAPVIAQAGREIPAIAKEIQIDRVCPWLAPGNPALVEEWGVRVVHDCPAAGRQQTRIERDRAVSLVQGARRPAKVADIAVAVVPDQA